MGVYRPAILTIMFLSILFFHFVVSPVILNWVIFDFDFDFDFDFALKNLCNCFLSCDISPDDGIMMMPRRKLSSSKKKYPRKNIQENCVTCTREHFGRLESRILFTSSQWEQQQAQYPTKSPTFCTNTLGGNTRFSTGVVQANPIQECAIQLLNPRIRYTNRKAALKY